MDLPVLYQKASNNYLYNCNSMVTPPTSLPSQTIKVPINTTLGLLPLVSNKKKTTQTKLKTNPDFCSTQTPNTENCRKTQDRALHHVSGRPTASDFFVVFQPSLNTPPLRGVGAPAAPPAIADKSLQGPKAVRTSRATSPSYQQCYTSCHVPKNPRPCKTGAVRVLASCNY